MNTRIFFQSFGGDTSYGDKVYFVLSCESGIDPDSPPADTVALIRNE